MENKPSEHLSNIFTIKPTNGFAYLDNDTIKRTILAQEATFQEQKNLMELECQRGGLSEHSQEKMYSSPSGGIRTIRKVEPPTGHDMKKPSKKIMKGKYIDNSRSTQEKLAFQVPNDAHVDAFDDDVVILSEKPANSSTRNTVSTPGTNVKDLQLPADAHDDVVILLEKPVKSLTITSGSVLGTNEKDLQVRDDAHADDSNHDVVILSERPTNSLPRNNGSILGINGKNLQVPTGAHVDNCDDDVVILLEKSANSLPRNDGSILGKNVNLNIDGSSSMNKKWISGSQPSYVSTMNDLNKKIVGPYSNMGTTNFPSVGCSTSQNQVCSSAGVNLNLPNVKLEIEPSSHMSKNCVSGLEQSGVSTVNVFNRKVAGSSSIMKIEDSPSVGASSSQNQCYSSPGVNMDILSLEDTFRGKHLGAAIDSKFFVANEEARHNNPYIHTKYDRSNNGMECFTHEKNGVDSSTAHDHSIYGIHNPQTFAASSSSAAFKSLWKSNNKDYTTRRYYGGIEVPNGQTGCLPTLREYCRLPTPNITQLGEAQYQKQSQFYNCPKDMNLGNGPQDAAATLEQARDGTPMEISWVKNNLLNMRKEISAKKSQVPSNYAAGQHQILPGSMVNSEGNTRILGFPINAAIDKDSQLSCTMHMGTASTPTSKGVANMEMQFQNKDDTNARNLIDLNVALPFIDEMDIDARLSEGDTVPQEHDHSSNEALVVTSTKNLMAMHKDKFQARSPEGNNNDDDCEALKISILLTQENKRSENHDIATASRSNAYRWKLCQVPRMHDDAYRRLKENLRFLSS
ncbi:hypothetical protein VPH35_081599 [Triticum aestivum]